MKKFLLTTVSALCISTGAFAEEPVKIFTGSSSGSYNQAFGPAIANILKGSFFESTVVPTQGTSDNIARVVSDPTAIGVGQVDVIASSNANVSVIRQDIAKECLFAVTRNPKITSWTQVVNNSSRIRLATAGQASGSNGTLGNLITIDPNLAAITNHVTYNAEGAVGAVKSVIEGKSHVAFFVQFPDQNNAVFKLASDNRLSFVPVVDRSILRFSVNGITPYEASNISFVGEKFVTSCTHTAVFTGNRSSFAVGTPERKDQDDKIATIMSANENDFRPSEGNFAWLRTAWNSAKRVTGSALASVVDSADKVRNMVVDNL